ncbi:aminoacyl-tRNA deacylase [Carnobacteriaceae bacterium 52-44]
MRLLEQADIAYKPHNLKDVIEDKSTITYKTLVTEGKTNENYVFLVPIDEELDLKKAAKAVDEKSIEMIKEKELRPLTGYVHGGCSPIGMKKELPTIIDQSAFAKEAILFSAGKKGISVEVNPGELLTYLSADIADVTKDS